jgi:Tol biopolymer transport system component
MALSSGKRLGSYEILGTVGSGGQGEVYKATDTRLGRLVAIKVLHSAFYEQEEFRQRFEREAQTVAALNDPHICTLYDIGQHDGMNFLVMEFLEGETLAARLTRGALPLDDALRIATQVSDALDKAHSLGVTHRDLKPGNIMLTTSGAKLMDFGLAKRREPVGPGISSKAPTAGANLTQQGSLLGTVQYMAPEQIEGEEADPRTDIFAFGVVLYEMISGARAFSGKSQASLMASILHQQPAPLATVQTLTPPALQRVVEICMAKEPRDRWQTAHDVSLQLKWIAEGGSLAGIPAPVKLHRRRREWMAWAVAAAGLVSALALAIPYVRKAPDAESVMRFPVAANEGTFFGPGTAGIRPFPAISPDGRRIVFQAQRMNEPVRLWVRSLDALQAVELAGTDNAGVPFWSPDSRSIAFTADRKLKRIDAAGGPVQIVCDVPDGIAEGSWNQDGTIVFSHVAGTFAPNNGILRVPAAGGTPAVVIAPSKDRQETALLTPFFLPDGKHFVYLAQAPSFLYAGSLDPSEPPKKLVPSESHAVYSNGFLLFVQQGKLLAQRFDPARLEVSGSPITVAEPVRTNPQNGRSAFSASENGTLVYLTGVDFGGVGHRVVWFDRQGKADDSLNQTDDNLVPVLSPDEKRLLVRRGPAVRNSGCTKNCSDLWTIDVMKGTNTRITFGTADPAPGGWSPDGTRIFYRSNPDGPYAIYTKPSTGVGNEELLLKFDKEISGVWDWSRDNKFILFTVSDPKTGTDIWALPLSGDRKPIPFVQVPGNQFAPRFSPDGRWIAYASNESGHNEVYIQPFPPNGKRIQVSIGFGAEPRWRGDGKELFFITNNRGK